MFLRELYIQEDNWVTHKDLANMLYKHTGNKQLAIDFFHLESEFDSQDDMQSTGLTALDIDPFAGDRERVNRILSINKVPVKVLKMKHNDAYETLYSLLQSAPVSEAPIGSYGKSGSDHNVFDVDSGYQIPKSRQNPNYKGDKNLSKAKQISTQKMSKQLAMDLHKQNPDIMQDITRFKELFRRNTPPGLVAKDSFRLARVMLSTGELQDFTDGRFNMGTPVGDGKDDNVKRAEIIKLLRGYVKQNDKIFDRIASKHSLTPNDLTAFVYYITGDDDLAATWFEDLKRTLQLSNPYDT